MDLRGIANRTVTTVNPDVSVTVRVSTGYTIGAGRKQAPTYAADVVGVAQVQALSGRDLRQIDGLNLQGTLKSIYLRGKLAGVVRPDGVGGDLIQHDGHWWLVVHILENWPDWTKAVICLQEAAA